MQPIDDSQSPLTTMTPAEAIRDLLFLAGALRGESEEVQHGKVANREPLILAGWTIYRAEKSGLLRSFIDLEQAVDAFYLRSMDKGVPMLLSDRRNDNSMPPIIRDVGKTIEQFIQQLEANAERQHDGAQSADRLDKSPLHLDLEPDVAAQSLVSFLWDFLAANHREDLPDELKLLYLDDHPLARLAPDSSPGLRKAAWVCRFLADGIAGRANGVGQSQWITVAAASKRIERPAGTISRACKREEITNNGKTGRARRLDPQSVDDYGKRLNREEELQGFRRDEEDRQKGLKNGWICDSCKSRHNPGPSPGNCKQCKKARFHPAPALGKPDARNVAQGS